MTDEICEMLIASKYDGEYLFAFDDYRDAPIITKKLRLLRKYTDAICKFYCFTGFDRHGKWDDSFWKRDMLELLYCIEILMRHRCLPYVMRYERYFHDFVKEIPEAIRFSELKYSEVNTE